MKRWLTAFVLILLATILLPQTALATERTVTAEGTCGENLTWTLYDDGTLCISGSGAMTNFSENGAPWFSKRTKITALEFDGTITSIGSYAFFHCYKLDCVTIPEGVTSVGYQAFSSCSNLTSVVIPEGVTSIGSAAFFSCSNLTSVEIPEGVTSIGSSAFRDCNSLTSIEIPASVKRIGEHVFEYCSSLTSIEIPNSVTSIDYRAFADCSSLTSIEIPESVTSIDHLAFADCSSLTAINVSLNNANYSSVDGIVFNKNQTVLFIYPCGKNGAYTIPDSVTSIGSAAFWNCSSLTSITIPDSVTNIGTQAFQYCRGLTSIEIPDSVTSIGSSAFQNCSSLTSIVIPDSVTSIVDSTFWNCSSLTSIVIPDSVTSIGKYAFRNCSSLTSIEIPDSVTSIGSSAFQNCSSLTSIVIPDSVTYIGEAFGGCSALEEITLPFVGASVNNSPFAKLFGYIFGDSQYTGGTRVRQYYEDRSSSFRFFYIPASLRTVTITGGDIPYGAFYGCHSLTNIVLSDGVTSIGSCAFYECSGLTSASISEGVMGIGSDAFFGCSSLTSIEIPESVMRIAQYAFSGCSSLASVTFCGNAPYISGGVFSGVNATAYYRGCNKTWTSGERQNYGGSITWVDRGHTCAEEEYVWADDLSAATLNATCDCGRVQTVACTLSREEVERGKVIFTASAEVGGATYSQSRELITLLDFGQVEIEETEVAYGVVYDNTGRLIHIGPVEVVDGEVCVHLSDNTAARMKQAKLFVLDSATMAPSGAAIMPK